ncbi:hypothetical protein [Croceitalea rosinachiae]|uniref:Outer membrane protein beta-barrel domain-containing protein n=1 Tax=Croceitalea rosinachiae TaxID=3075596 RepID=A0ABU3A659_9FLAO|nr:hypothetical protein [Croceitalea sp. F388]MDT0605662.1 hypothetical protein [Croceitalea sp. F388]
MKKIMLILGFLLANSNLFGQINFEPGYFLNNRNERTECLIKNNDWKDNPESFVYKLPGQEERLEASVKEVKEFGVIGKSVFVSVLVDIDRSSNILRLMSSKREPDNSKERLFLRRLVDGDIDLYDYEAGNLVRYFYSAKESEILPLVHKKYINQRNQVAENNQYKQQLLNEFGNKASDLEKLAYKKMDLVKYFIGINEEMGVIVDKNIETQKVKKGVFHFSLMGGMDYRALSFERRNTSFPKVDYGSNIAITFGAEIEYVFPFNKNKWALFLEPSYTSYNSETTVAFDGSNDIAIAEFDSFEIVFGVRHYMFINDSVKLFLNGIINYAITSPTSINLGPSRPSVGVSSTIGPAFGFGMDLYNKLGLEMRYQYFGNIVTSTANGTSSNFGGLSLILNYQLL